jgi:hypothetical protein
MGVSRSRSLWRAVLTWASQALTPLEGVGVSDRDPDAQQCLGCLSA